MEVPQEVPDEVPEEVTQEVPEELPEVGPQEESEEELAGFIYPWELEKQSDKEPDEECEDDLSWYQMWDHRKNQRRNQRRNQMRSEMKNTRRYLRNSNFVFCSPEKVKRVSRQEKESDVEPEERIPQGFVFCSQEKVRKVSRQEKKRKGKKRKREESDEEPDERISQGQAKVQKLEAKIVLKESNKDTLVVENNSLKEANDELNKKITELESKHKTKIEDSDKKYKKTAELVRVLQAQLEQKERNSDTLVAENNSLKKANDEQNKKTTELEGKQRRMMGVIKNAKTKIEESDKKAAEEIRALQAQLESQQTQLEAYKKQALDLAEVNAQLTAQKKAKAGFAEGSANASNTSLIKTSQGGIPIEMGAAAGISAKHQSPSGVKAAKRLRPADEQMTMELEEAKKARVSIQPTSNHQTDRDVLSKNGSITETVSPTKATWSQEYTDFAVIACSHFGKEELKCHKHVLAENSPLLKGLLKTDYSETKTNQMRIENFQVETVISFLNYLYAPVRDTETIEALKALHHGPKKYIFTRKFEAETITLDLLKMSHMYQVEDLQMDCAEYLGDNLGDNNVVEVWMEAEKMDNPELGNKAVSYLIHQRKGKNKIMEVPGVEEWFNSLERPIRQFLCVLAQKAGLDILP